MDLTTLTLKDAASRIESGELTSTELSTVFLERIRKLNPKLNAFITITQDHALRSARIADEELKARKYRGPLHGIPIAIKDLFETKGIKTTAGSKILADYVPNQDAFVVKKLAEAGAVLLGKLNMHEWALGVTSLNPHFGPVINPWDPERIAGGSSGGSAVALAANLCSASLGSDTGGSIRIPSALCGTVGLKPTYGLVSLRGAVPLSWSLDHVGPMARNVQDLALVLQVIAGYDEDDPASVNRPKQDYLMQIERGVEGLRICVPTNYFFDRVEAGISEFIRRAAKKLEELGAVVTESSCDNVELDTRANGIILLSEAAAYHRQHLLEQPEAFGADVLSRLRTGELMSAVDLASAQRTRVDSIRSRSKFFEKFDVMITPVTPAPALLRAGLDAVEAARKLTSLTSPFNLAGLPALSLPCGFTPEGLPVGMQMVAGPWKEATLLRAAYAYEAATEWHKKWPSLNLA